jgi:hypothetical protein
MLPSITFIPDLVFKSGYNPPTDRLAFTIIYLPKRI